jgi:hypothetical protein
MQRHQGLAIFLGRICGEINNDKRQWHLFFFFIFKKKIGNDGSFLDFCERLRSAARTSEQKSKKLKHILF